MLSSFKTVSCASRGGVSSISTRPASVQAASSKQSGPHHKSSTGGKQSISRKSDEDPSRRQLLNLGFFTTVGVFSSSKPAQATTGTLADLLQPMRRQLDPNADNIMDLEELRTAVSAAMDQRTPLDVIRTAVVPAVDFDEDGVVSTDEFMRALSLDLPVDQGTWAVIDKNADGVATITELRNALGNIGGEGGEAVLQVAFEHADSGSHQLNPQQASMFMDWLSTGIVGDMEDAVSEQ